MSVTRIHQGARREKRPTKEQLDAMTKCRGMVGDKLTILDEMSRDAELEPHARIKACSVLIDLGLPKWVREFEEPTTINAELARRIAALESAPREEQIRALREVVARLEGAEAAAK